MLDILPIPAFNDNYIWLIHDLKHAIVVDPGDAKPVIRYLSQHGLKLVAILLTHHHADHTGGVKAIVDKFPTVIYGPAGEATQLSDIKLKENDEIDIPELQLHFSILDIPGHTKGHIAYYGHDMLFCGDTLFSAGCGRLFEGTAAEMYQSLMKLKALPNQTQVYCAHEYTLNNLRFAKTIEPNNQNLLSHLKRVEQLRANNTPTLPVSLAIEKEINPFLRCDEKKIIAKIQAETNNTVAADAVSTFAYIRQLKDNF